MKDPAFLFYSGDFMTGTYFFTDEQLGKYIRLLCMQHQKGHLAEKDMLNICKTYEKDIYDKFVKDDKGNFYNERLENEITKRTKYSESRRNNRKSKQKEQTEDEDMKKICNTYEKHMENENEDENININLNNKEKLQIKFIECIGSTNLNAIQECIDYLETLPYEVIEHVLIKTSRISKPNWGYADSILKDYEQKKIDSMEKVKTEELSFKTGKQPIQETDEEKDKKRIAQMTAVLEKKFGGDTNGI